MHLKKGHELFVSRLYDALDQCSWRQKRVLTSFLSPAEQQTAQTLLQNKANLHFWGGYENAQRKQLCISLDGTQADDIVCLHDPIQTSHPKVLGALLHLGIERDQLGDILCTDQGIYVFCRQQMAEYILQNCTAIQSQPVTFKEYLGSIPESAGPEEITVQAACLRLDAIVAALANCSRKEAAEKISHGLVKVNDIVAVSQKPIHEKDILSIRKAGRFQYMETLRTTRKGRLVLAFQKFR